MDRSFWLSLIIRVLAATCILLTMGFCLANKHWHLRTASIVGFIFAFLTIIALLLSIIITTTFKSHSITTISCIIIELAAWIMSLTSTILFGITIRVCVQNIFGKCSSYYYSTTFMTGTIFAFLCGLLTFLDLLRAFLIDFCTKQMHQETKNSTIAVQTQQPQMLTRANDQSPARRSSSSISRFAESTSSSVRIAHIRCQTPVQTNI